MNLARIEPNYFIPANPQALGNNAIQLKDTHIYYAFCKSNHASHSWSKMFLRLWYISIETNSTDKRAP